MSDSINRIPIKRYIAAVFQGFDLPLMLGLIALMAIGLTAMYSSAVAFDNRFDSHARNMAVAVTVMFIVAQIPPSKIAWLALPMYIAGVLLLIAVAVMGITKNGSTRWVNIGVVIQPSELLKIAVPLMLAWWFQRRDEGLRTLDYVFAVVLLAVPAGLILKQPDLGTTLLVLLAGMSVIFFAGLSWKLVLPPLIIGAIGIVLLVLFESRLCAEGVEWFVIKPYQQVRVCTLLDPTRDPLGKGFHTLQGMIAIGSGGVMGKGFMQGTQTHLSFIPERTTDFIFATYSEEFGLIGNILLLLVYFFLVCRILWIAAKATSIFGRLLSGAIGVIVFAYTFVNMGMVSGILPVVGVPLPFVSYGGTAMLTLGLAFGMVFSIGRDYRKQQAQRYF